ncbi:MAG TPA: hypothetical protein VLB84_01015, partial [Bacteroidia bacterium]|nr:hypothetical protein [Bacteroidia bacterium]
MHPKQYIHYSFLGICFIFLFHNTQAQQNLPVGFSQEELQRINDPDFTLPEYVAGGITSPPKSPVRNMAQWEEIQALTITWTSYQSVLREIVRAAEKETTVIISTGSSSDVSSIKSYLTSGNVPLTNVKFNITPIN